MPLGRTWPQHISVCVSHWEISNNDQFFIKNENVVRYSFSGPVFIDPELNDLSSLYGTHLSPVCLNQLPFFPPLENMISHFIIATAESATLLN